jgi:sec-independent protein translocase protein TatA
MLAMFTPGPMELCIIAGIAVLLFGNRLPKVARSVGSSFVEFKKGLTDVKEIQEDIKSDVKQATKEVKDATKMDA